MEEVVLTGENVATGVDLAVTGVIIAGVLVAVCVVLAILSSVKKKKNAQNKPVDKKEENK